MHDVTRPVAEPGSSAEFPPAWLCVEPEAPSWKGARSLVKSMPARLETLFTALFSFGWKQVDETDGWKQVDETDVIDWARSRKDVGEAFKKSWDWNAYFADGLNSPDEWAAKFPDLTLNSSQPLISPFKRFKKFDRAATFGAALHRAAIIVSHLLGAFAVFAAVAGHLDLWVSEGAWSLIELFCLASIASIIFAIRHLRLQDRWMRRRAKAECLRVKIMLTAIGAETAKTGAGPGEAPMSSVTTNDFVIQALTWTTQIIQDQVTYHETNEKKLDCMEGRIRLMVYACFVGACLAVMCHFISEWQPILLFTAALPALAAALNGIGERLNLVHRASESKTVVSELKKVDSKLSKVKTAIDGLIKNQQTIPDEYLAVIRCLAKKAGAAMMQENERWHALLSRQRDAIPG
jgi:hypothetical protein